MARLLAHRAVGAAAPQAAVLRPGPVHPVLGPQLSPAPDHHAGEERVADRGEENTVGVLQDIRQVHGPRPPGAGETDGLLADGAAAHAERALTVTATSIPPRGEVAAGLYRIPLHLAPLKHRIPQHHRPQQPPDKPAELHCSLHQPHLGWAAAVWEVFSVPAQPLVPPVGLLRQRLPGALVGLLRRGGSGGAGSLQQRQLGGLVAEAGGQLGWASGEPGYGRQVENGGDPHGDSWL
mmetsp:Transcript_47691/g.108119  ORF Transcript_47691/g.108119 Transcript_47691/m.108119 type:complete len:236 (-) Transcript_47691:125-832(-)